MQRLVRAMPAAGATPPRASLRTAGCSRGSELPATKANSSLRRILSTYAPQPQSDTEIGPSCMQVEIHCT